MFDWLARIGVFSLAIVLSGPALKVRFLLTDATAYLLPTAAFCFVALFLNLLSPTGLPKRIILSVVLGLPLVATGYSFLLDNAGQSFLLIRIIMNCILGAAVVIFPWNEKIFTLFMAVLGAIGVMLAVDTILTYQSYIYAIDALSTIKEGRLSVSFTLGVGSLALLYFVVRSFSPITIGAWLICWVGLVLGISRGPVLFAAVATVVYLLFVMDSKVDGFGRIKKVAIVVSLFVMTPFVLAQLATVEATQARFARMFDFGRELKEGGRGDVWVGSLDRFLQSPLFGNGLGSYIPFTGSSPHNIFLQYAEDSGLVGLIIIIAFFVIITSRIIRSVRLAVPKTANMVYASGAIFLYMFLNFQKSSDAYISRESFVLSALPLGVFAYLIVGKQVGALEHIKNRRRRQVVRQTYKVPRERKIVPSKSRERVT